ncbi:hypothetical protein AB6A40_010542 [Gnathostoma spinigerum]|uniref:Uncharacterized protein n=1 Tax=Gnathostoma spinigerum TaxID=75299 RepID=A0ABD6F1X9_9BILA
MKIEYTLIVFHFFNITGYINIPDDDESFLGALTLDAVDIGIIACEADVDGLEHEAGERRVRLLTVPIEHFEFSLDVDEFLFTPISTNDSL